MNSDNYIVKLLAKLVIIMKKILVSLFTLCLMNLAIFAGDVAVFQEIGFSKDGKIYVFAEYGKQDKKFNPYAEIYTVDVAKNDFVPGKVYKVQDKSFTKASKAHFEELYAKHYSEIKKLECYNSQPEDILYIMEEESKYEYDEILFKSFEENEVTYNVKLVPTFYSGKSSFVINVSVYDQDNKLITEYQVGTPSVKRKNVTGYKIVRIVQSKDKQSIVFVVEKRIEDENGVSIRYMVETKRLAERVDVNVKSKADSENETATNDR